MNEALIKAALTPDFHSKAAYTGHIKQTETIEVFTEDGISISKEVEIYISWDTIVKMLELIKNRAGI